MYTIESKYLGELRTEAIHIRSGERIITDAPLDNHGKGQAFSPTDLMSASLGSCMITLMGISAGAHGFELKPVDLKITKIMVANPRRVGEIVLEFAIHGTYSEKEKKILEAAALSCPVALSLHPDLKQTVSFTYD